MSRGRKVLVLAVVAIVVAASAFSVWWFYGRYWSTKDIAAAVVLDNGPGSPGFKHSLADKAILVRGEVTNITTNPTTLGDMSFVEFDDFSEISLVAWGPLDFEIGDRATMEVRFEWSVCNSEEHVYSPQVYFPLYFSLPSIEMVISHYTWVRGAYLLADSVESGEVVIRLEDVESPLPLGECNCTLRSGMYGYAPEYLEAIGAFMDGSVRYGVEIDSMENLAEIEGVNGMIQYSDADGDGLLDSGDRFTLMNLPRPSMDSGMMTYMFFVCWESESEECGIVFEALESYLIMTNRGLLRYTDYPSPYARISSESIEGGQKSTIQFVGEPVSWDDIELTLSDGTRLAALYPEAAQLLGSSEVTVSIGMFALPPTTVFCNVTDVAGDGIVGRGDIITITCSGFAPFVSGEAYSLCVIYEPTGSSLGQVTFKG
jgi:hypothetical protein